MEMKCKKYIEGTLSYIKLRYAILVCMYARWRVRGWVGRYVGGYMRK